MTIKTWLTSLARDAFGLDEEEAAKVAVRAEEMGTHLVCGGWSEASDDDVRWCLGRAHFEYLRKIEEEEAARNREV